MSVISAPKSCSHWPGQTRCQVCGMGIVSDDEVYYSDVHESWVRRWEIAGEPFSENITGHQAGVLMTGGPQTCPDHETPRDYCQVCCAFGEPSC